MWSFRRDYNDAESMLRRVLQDDGAFAPAHYRTRIYDEGSNYDTHTYF